MQTLIMIRHAKAEDRRFGLADRDRKLTEDGIARFTEKMAPLRSRLEPLVNPVLWVSPSARTLETARILRDHYSLPRVEEHEWLYRQDMERLEDELIVLEDGATVVLVGHQPSLGAWVERLAHTVVPFKKGAVAQLTRELGDRYWHLDWLM